MTESSTKLSKMRNLKVDDNDDGLNVSRGMSESRENQNGKISRSKYKAKGFD